MLKFNINYMMYGEKGWTIMALSNCAYCYNFKSDRCFFSHYTLFRCKFHMCHMCQWGEDCVFFFVPQKLVKEVSFSHYTPTSHLLIIEHITHSELKVYTPHNHAFIRE